MVKGLCIIILTLLSCSSFAQIKDKSTAIWYFGDSAGVDFRTCEPKFLSDSKMQLQLEGSTSISDRNGNLLFYSNGYNVWNANHEIMPNGTLSAFYQTAFSTSQGIIAVSQPQNDRFYYLFSCVGSQLIYYIIDMNLQGGLGDISHTEFVYLPKINFTEKIAAVHHANDEDIWIALHEYESDSLYAFLFTANGFNPTPVISETGSIHDGNNYPGYLKFSPQGDKAACSKYSDGQIELYQFNDSTGIFSNAILIDPIISDKYTYGLEFSPDGSKLYTAFLGALEIDVVAKDEVYRFDVSNYNEGSILSSATKIGESIDGRSSIGAFQLALDGKIYVAQIRTDTNYNVYDERRYLDHPYLSEISTPNALNGQSNYKDTGIFLGNAKAILGFPNSIASAYKPIDFEIQENTGCMNEPTQFVLDDKNVDYESLTWNFGANNAISTSSNPAYVYDNIGVFTVSVYITDRCGSYSISKDIPIYDRPDFSLIDDTALCIGDSIWLQPIFQEYLSTDTVYRWSNKAEEPRIYVYEPGNYNLTIGSGQCKRTQSVTMNFTDCSNAFFIPNIITPNGDMVNDCFSIELEEIVAFNVYNRWGKEVYSNISFDGSWCDIQLVDGEYYYELNSYDPIPDHYTGWFQVLK